MTESLAHYPTKSDFAYALVRGRILSNEYPPGTALNQAQLAGALGISTTPLREALRRLKAEGLVELDAHRDAQVTTVSAEEARDLSELRGELDPLAAALAADRRTKQDLADMRGALAELYQNPNSSAVDDFVGHRRFHTMVYRASHNDLLVSTLDGIWDRVHRYRDLGLWHRRQVHWREEQAAEDRFLLAAIVAGDAPEAQQIMRDHISDTLGARTRQARPLPA